MPSSARPKFQFKILTGANIEECQQKYDAIVSKNPYTFYLFDKGGVGYLGGQSLFNKDTNKFNLISTNTTQTDLKANSMYFVTGNCTITNASSETVETLRPGTIWITDSSKALSEISETAFTNYLTDFIRDVAVHSNAITSDNPPNVITDDKLMTSAAVKELIDKNISAQAILNISFFRNVSAAIVLTQADITAGYVTATFTDEFGNPVTGTADLDSNCHVDDVGIVFMIQYGPDYTPSTDNKDKCIFINLHNLIDKYEAGVSNTTILTFGSMNQTTHRTPISVEVNKSDALNLDTKILTAISDYFDGSASEYDPTDAAGDNLSNDKFITESQFASIMYKLLQHFVPAVTGSGDSMIEDEEEF